MIAGAVAGLTVGALVSTVAIWQLAVVTGWIAGTATILCWVWLTIAELDAKGTAAIATRVDASREISRVLLLSASVVSLLAVGAAFHEAKPDSPHGLLLTSAAMISVIAAWLTVHTVYTLHYAHY